MVTENRRGTDDFKDDLRRMSSQIGDVFQLVSAHNVTMTQRTEEIRGMLLVHAAEGKAVEARVTKVEKKQEDFDKFKDKGLVFGFIAFALSGGFGAGVAHLAKKIWE